MLVVLIHVNLVLVGYFFSREALPAIPTHRKIVCITAGCVKGVGFIRSDGHGNSDLLTVKHVIEDNNCSIAYSFSNQSSNASGATQSVSRCFSNTGDPIEPIEKSELMRQDINPVVRRQLRRKIGKFPTQPTKPR